MTGYSRILVDSSVEDLWFLGEPSNSDGEELDARIFTTCRPFGKTQSPLLLPIEKRGRPVPLSFGAFDMPVASRTLGDSFALAAGGDVELVPAVAEDGTELSIVNVLPEVECIDESRTIGEKWTPEDGRPDKIGRYRTILELFIDPNRVDREIFRLAGRRIVLIVSDWFAEVTGLTSLEGIKLQPVT